MSAESGRLVKPASGRRLDVYVPRYGAEWEQFVDSGPVYARIDASRMFTFFMPADAGVS